MLKFASVVFAAGLALAAPALAQSGDAKATTPPPATPATDPAAIPPPPPAPTGIPVPTDLPVLKKTELEGGLVTEDLKIGEGYEVKAGGDVVAFYHGTLKSDGTVFDSAFERGEPVSFPLSGVIPGWQQGVPGMRVGGIRRLIIPAALAYGERSPSPKIPANADLVFIIQLEDALQVEDVKVGEGEEVGPRPVVVTAHSIRTTEGKEVEMATAAKPGIWLPGEFQGISMGIDGMRVGGKRKFTIPKAMNKPNPMAPPSTRPTDVALVVEVELLAVKNLVPPQPRK